jgi:hypothetical protein
MGTQQGSYSLMLHKSCQLDRLTRRIKVCYRTLSHWLKKGNAQRWLLHSGLEAGISPAVNVPRQWFQTTWIAKARADADSKKGRLGYPSERLLGDFFGRDDSIPKSNVFLDGPIIISDVFVHTMLGWKRDHCYNVTSRHGVRNAAIPFNCPLDSPQ